MKKIFSFIIIASMILGIFVIPTSAQNTTTISDSIENIVSYEDGSYMKITVVEISNTNNAKASSTTTTRYKTYAYHNSSDEMEWEYKIYGTFTYVYGSSVTCTASSYDYTIYKDSWKFSDGSTSHSGATAYGYGTFKNKFLFVTTKTINVEAEITCDVYGNIS